MDRTEGWYWVRNTKSTLDPAWEPALWKKGRWLRGKLGANELEQYGELEVGPALATPGARSWTALEIQDIVEDVLFWAGEGALAENEVLPELERRLKDTTYYYHAPAHLS